MGGGYGDDNCDLNFVVTYGVCQVLVVNRYKDTLKILPQWAHMLLLLGNTVVGIAGFGSFAMFSSE